LVPTIDCLNTPGENLVHAIILAGGRGTRLKPYTVCFPKPLVPIGNQPILEVVIRQLAHYGFDRITISTGHLAELIEAYFGDGRKWGVRIEYVREERPLNTAGALKLIGNMDENVLVMNGDVLTTLNYREFMEHHISKGVKASVATKIRQAPIDFGVVEADETCMLANYIEKPVYTFAVSMGVYALHRTCCDLIAHGEAIGMPDLLLRLKNNGNPVYCHRSDCYWLDIGRIDDYEKALEEFDANLNGFLPQGLS